MNAVGYAAGVMTNSEKVAVQICKMRHEGLFTGKCGVVMRDLQLNNENGPHNIVLFSLNKKYRYEHVVHPARVRDRDCRVLTADI